MKARSFVEDSFRSEGEHLHGCSAAGCISDVRIGRRFQSSAKVGVEGLSRQASNSWAISGS
jgi:hypothetical protein